MVSYSGGLLVVISTALVIRGLSQSTKDSTEVKIPQGLLKGKELLSRDGKPFYGFMGIPYAQQPERFEPAKLPPPTWNGTLDATNYKPKCLQLNFTGEVQGEEKCLWINVFTPNPSGNMSVLAFIHGGGFQFGLAYENGPEFIMDHDVVFVTFSYRLAALGFLSTEDDILPGNLGLKDQNLALRWIQENIKFFGGDANRVTLFGESAGAASVSLHIVSPMSLGLFRHAICQSGSSLDRWPVVEHPKRTAIKLAKHLNCPVSTSEEIVRCLKTKSGKEIIGAQLRTSILESMITYGPVIETITSNSSNAFLTESPRKIYDEGRFTKVPLIITVNDIEGLLVNALGILMNPAALKAFNNDWHKAASVAFVIDSESYTEEARLWATKKLREFYFGSKPIGKETLFNLTDIYTDSTFLHRSKIAATLHSKYAPVYVSILAFKGIWSQALAMGFNEIIGMTHADDLSYLFTDYRYPPFPRGSESEAFSKLLVQQWVNFANTGDPNYEIGGKKWSPVTEAEIILDKLQWLYQKKQPELREEPFKQRMQLWDKIDEVLESGLIPNSETASKTEL